MAAVDIWEQEFLLLSFRVYTAFKKLLNGTKESFEAVVKDLGDRLKQQSKRELYVAAGLTMRFPN